jgi:hypothetical protein
MEAIESEHSEVLGQVNVADSQSYLVPDEQVSLVHSLF